MNKPSDAKEAVPNGTMLQRWFSRAPGTLLLDAERTVLKQILPYLFGYHIVQLGRLGQHTLMQGSRISHQVLIEVDGHSQLVGGATERAQLRCLAAFLPFEADSVDVMILPHVLEFNRDPHQVLREVERSLIPEGHVVILGLNPWSLWGLWRMFLAWRADPPWCGRYLTVSRLRDWLHLLGFDVETTRRVYYRPPLRSVRANQKLAFLEKLGAYLWPVFGAAYIVVGKKRLIPLTPIRMHWDARRRLIASGLAEPSTRIRTDG